MLLKIYNNNNLGSLHLLTHLKSNVSMTFCFVVFNLIKAHVEDL